MHDVVVRDAQPTDAEECAEIYRHYVMNTAVTFELGPPTADVVRERIASAQARHAWMVAVRGGEVHGYAYAFPLAERPAYRWACEVSAYVDPGLQGAGVGTRLYSALLGRLTLRGLHVAVARISQPNPASESLHARLGFERVGVLRRIGFKNGAWHDVAIHQLELADAAVPPGEPS